MNKFLELKTLHIRMTTNKTIKDIETFILTLTPLTYLISQEGFKEDHTHYHILVQSQSKDDNSNTRLRKAINTKLGLKGNGQFSISTVRNEKQLMKYILKDGGPIARKGIPDEVIEVMKKCSSKKGTKNLSADLSILEEKYFQGIYSFNKFGEEYIKLKIAYNQNLYSNHIKAYLTKMELKKEPERIRQYVLDIMSR